VTHLFHRFTKTFLSCCAVLFTLASVSTAMEDRAGLVFFESNIRPILAVHCYDCHSSEEGVSKGGLTLDTRAGWEMGGDSGPAIVAGKVEESLLIKAVRYTDADLAMPPKKKGGKLPASHIAKLEQWVAMGAPDPRDGEVKKLTGITPEARRHWIYGESDELGAEPAKDPVHLHDLHATILRLLGFDHTQLTYRYNGRDFRLTDNFGQIVKGIIA
jgi:hypothetical protein